MNVQMKNEQRDERSDRLDRNEEIKIIRLIQHQFQIPLRLCLKF